MSFFAALGRHSRNSLRPLLAREAKPKRLSTIAPQNFEGTIVYPAEEKYEVAGSKARVIFGHGLGDTPEGWAECCGFWNSQLPWIEFCLPAAPIQPVTLNGGMEMPSWYDLPSAEELHSNRYASRLEIEATGIDQAAATYCQLLENPSRTVFAGFSQGAAVALYAGLNRNAIATSEQDKLAGILSLSGYLPNSKGVSSDGPKGLPVLMCHGRQDEMVEPKHAEATFAELQTKHSCDAQLKWYGMGHTAVQEEIDDVVEWLRLRFPQPDE